ncbi:VirB4 family type IV secretion/conjugal transfer ATPase [Propionivibrio sp.]|uniref:VirB4 family type IV secretion/conjugal transfer ATPase n=1 Tax=Propionivibrio sp. TaxID=2212460 RepID=UPI0039E70F89
MPILCLIGATSHGASSKAGTAPTARPGRFDGITWKTSDPQDLLTRHEGLNQMIRGLGHNVSIWIHRIRRPTSDRLLTDYDNDFARDLAERYYDSFTGTRMMATELYFTIVYRPTESTVASNPLLRVVSSGKPRSLAAVRANEHEAIREMEDLAYKVESGLKKFETFPLEMREPEPSGVVFSDQLAFYGFLINGVWRRVGVQQSSIGNYLATSRVLFAGEMLEIRRPDQQLYVGFLDFKDYPSDSGPGILNTLFDCRFAFIETHSFSIYSKADGKSALETQQGQLMAAEDAAGNQIQAMDKALEQLIDGKFVMGEYHYSLAVMDADLDAITKHLAQAETAINDAGFQVAQIDLVADSAWAAQLPGNWRYRPRIAKITSRNFAGLASMHSFGSGKRDYNPWGEAVTVLKTPSGERYYLNFHGTDEKEDSTDKKPPANTMIIGMTGSGKTVLELFLICMLQKFGVTVVIYDKDRGCEIAIRALGGNYRTLRRGTPTGFNPFWLQPTEQNIRFVEQLIRSLIPRSLSPVEAKALDGAIRATFAFDDKSKRRLAYMHQMLPLGDEHSMHAYLGRWVQGGALGWVLDNPEDTLDLTSNTLYGFDDTDFLEDPEVLAPVTAYLLHCTESLIDGRRFVYVMAEFWKRLQLPVFAEFAGNKQYTIRKQNGFGIFDTQSPAQILGTKHVAAMVEQSATQIFLPNRKADRKDYIDGFKVTEAEFDIISTLDDDSRQFLVKQNGKSTLVQLDLKGMDDVLDILSATSDNVEMLDDIRLAVGDDPARWIPVFRQRLEERRTFTREKKRK